MFFWNSLAISMIQWILAIWSLVPLPFLNPAYTSVSSWFILLKPNFKDFGHALLVCEMNATAQKFENFLALPFFGIGMKTDLFQSCGHCWVFQVCWHSECSTFTALYFRIWNSSIGIPSTPLTLFIVMLPAAAAKSLQLCPTPCDPIDGSPPGSSVPGILQARILEWVAISFSKDLSCIVQKILYLHKPR